MSSGVAADNSKSDTPQSSTWVHFEEEEPHKNMMQSTEQINQISSKSSNTTQGEYSGAVISPETVHVNVNKRLSRTPEKHADISGNEEATLTSSSSPQHYSGAVINTESVHVNLDRSNLNRSISEEPPQQLEVATPAAKAQDTRGAMRTVDLRDVSNGRSAPNTRIPNLGNAIIRQGFANGDIVVTLLPINTRWPWITPAQFRPELVPEELMAQGLTKKLQEVIDKEEREGRPVNREETSEERRQRQQFQQRMDIEDRDIIIQGSNTTRLSRKQVRGEQLLARYIQRWAKDFLRRRLDWTVDEEGGNPVDPRHLSSALCPCQYVEEYLRNKPHSDSRAFCPCCSSYLTQGGID